MRTAEAGSGNAPSQDNDFDDDAGLHEARTLAALKHLLADTPASDLPAVLSCLGRLAWQRKTIASAARRQPRPAELAALASRLKNLLGEFNRLAGAGVIDLNAAAPDAAAAICRGLGVLECWQTGSVAFER